MDSPDRRRGRSGSRHSDGRTRFFDNREQRQRAYEEEQKRARRAEEEAAHARRAEEERARHLEERRVAQEREEYGRKCVLLGIPLNAIGPDIKDEFSRMGISNPVRVEHEKDGK